MADPEIPANSALLMDRGLPLGNSLDVFSRRALHVKIANLLTESVPVLTRFIRDGVVVSVLEDTAVPANGVALPVKLMGVTGPVNITAGDLNVQLSDLGANFDRTRIGDGVNQLGITSSSEALVNQRSISASGTGASLNATPIPSTDVRDWGAVALQITGTFVATNTFEGSNDGATWVPTSLQSISTPTTGPVTSTGSTGIFVGMLPFRFFRVRISAYTSGTVSALAEFKPRGIPYGNGNYIRHTDGAGNLITSQVSGSQRALDVGIDVAGVQVDPRQVGIARITIPGTYGDGTQNPLTIDERGRIVRVSRESVMTLWGRAWLASTDIISSGSTAETPLLLIRNPVSSGRTMKVSKIILGSPLGGTISYRFYLNPTVTANGTTLTPVGKKQVGMATPVTLFSTLPTVSANGTFFGMNAVDSGSQDLVVPYENGLWLEPNNAILVTVKQSTAPNGGHMTWDFSEE